MTPEMEDLKKKILKLKNDHEDDLKKLPDLNYMSAESKDRTNMALRHKILAFNEILDLLPQ